MSMAMDLLKEIVFWVVVTLIAGFVGYVGRYGAECLLKRRRQGQSGSPGGQDDRAKEQAALEAERIREDAAKEQAKVEKKKAKAAAKSEKKRNKD